MPTSITMQLCSSRRSVPTAAAIRSMLLRGLSEGMVEERAMGMEEEMAEGLVCDRPMRN
jgi:hypothetical protein